MEPRPESASARQDYDIIYKSIADDYAVSNAVFESTVTVASNAQSGLMIVLVDKGWTGLVTAKRMHNVAKYVHKSSQSH